MAQERERVVAGTAEEITEYLRSADLGDKQLTLIVPCDDQMPGAVKIGSENQLKSELKDEGDFFSNPPLTIRSQGHLEELLLEGINSGEPTPMTDQDWDDIRQQVHARASQRARKS